MILNAWGVVLAGRDHREADRLSTLYTETLGKLTVRFVGVKKPARKLKALSEPLVWGEYRLYLSPRTDMAKAIGGRIISSFPAIRSDLRDTVAALSCCEMLAGLTPERSPNAGKYRLICEALEALEGGPSPWLQTAFALQLLELSGYGARDLALAPRNREDGSAVPGPLPYGQAPADERLWKLLHQAPLGALGEVPWEPAAAARLEGLALDRVESHLERALRSRGFSERLVLQPEGVC